MTAGLAVAATTAALVAGPTHADKPVGNGASTGTGQVFKVNPVQSSGDQTLTDSKDANTPELAAQYAQAQLRNLDGSGTLSGKWANIRTTTGTPAFSATNTFVYTRDQDQFEQVMGYFWVNQAQEYLQSLGFKPGGRLDPILARPYDLRINQYGVDNSYMTDTGDYIRLGKGGVDDAEDAEVIMHEYGHAIHADQVPGFYSTDSIDTGAIGESFGDYFAVSTGLAAAKQYGWPVKAEQACPMDWDATAYTNAPHCIRRFDLNLTLADRRNQVHYDGQIWSQALWEIRQAYVAAGKTTAAWDTTLIDSQFDYAPGTSFQDAARVTFAAAVRRDGPKYGTIVKDAFARRGITF
ncbi:MAG: M36 family metallopeptidase [Nocardioides sp.]